MIRTTTSAVNITCHSSNAISAAAETISHTFMKPLAVHAAVHEHYRLQIHSDKYAVPITSHYDNGI